MKTRLKKLQEMRPASLEWERRCILTEMQPFEFAITDASKAILATLQRRLNQVDRVIASRAGEVVTVLENRHSEYLAKGWHREAERVTARICEIQGHAADCKSEREQAERVAEPSLRLVAPSYVAEIRRAYADDAILLPDMLGELEVAA